MALQFSSTDLTFSGPAPPEAFVQHELEWAHGKVGKKLNVLRWKEENSNERLGLLDSRIWTLRQILYVPHF